MGKDKKEIEDQEYYHGFLDAIDLPALLLENGDFLVRMAEVQDGKKADISLKMGLSVMVDKGADKPDDRIRTIMLVKKRKKYSLGDGMFATITEMVDHYVQKGATATIAAGGKDVTFTLKKAVNRQAWELSHDDITQVKKLGEGAFGEVWLGKLRTKTKRKIDVAVKIAKKGEQKEQASVDKMKELMKEARLMRNFEHPNIVKMHGVAIEQEPLMIVMEFVEGGGLDEYLKKNRSKVNLDEKFQIVMGAAWGLEYLHFKNCIHRDIAARNCLYNGKTVKISDFGLSREGTIYQLQSVKRLPVRWLSPETMTEGTYTQKSDVFSFGILVWEIYSNGEEPYQGIPNAEIQAQVCNGYRMEMDPEAPEAVCNLVRDCWDGKPETRCDISVVARALEAMTKVKVPAANREIVEKRKEKKRKGGMTEENDVTKEMTTVDQTVERTVDEGAQTSKKKNSRSKLSREAVKKKSLVTRSKKSKAGK